MYLSRCFLWEPLKEAIGQLKGILKKTLVSNVIIMYMMMYIS